MKRKKQNKKVASEREAFNFSASQPVTGELWIDPKLNRTVAGAGGNRGEHTTSSAKLLHLADIALKKDA